MLYTYINRKGDSLFEVWFEKVKHQDPSIYQKTSDVLYHMVQDDLPMNPPNVRHMTKRTGNHSLYKIRLGKYRLFFLAKDNNYYLLHVFRKSSQTTPEKEIKQVLREVKEANYRLVSFEINDDGEIIYPKEKI